MKTLKRLGAIFMALAMVATLVLPTIGSVEAENNVTETVTLHKILQKESFANSKFPGKEGLNNEKYTGNELKDIKGYFGGEASEIAGVYFALKFAKTYKAADGSTELAGKYVLADADKKTPKTPLQGTDDIKLAVGGLTEANGITFKTSSLKGDFEIDEIHNMSTYVGTGGATLTANKAVPVQITLPVINETGVVGTAHVYPKNKEEKPETTKTFEEKDGFKVTDGLESQEGTLNPKGVNVGTKIPYLVTTKVPAQSKYATANWFDNMTEGLTYDKNLVISLDEEVLQKNTHYTIEEKENGFNVKLNEEGLKKINNQENAKTITLKYTATVNSKAVSKIPESNDITFQYGNNKGHGNTPVPNKPNQNGEMTVKKEWDSGATQKEVVFTLYDAHTGKKVESKDIKQISGYNFENPVTLQANGTMSYTWKGLDKDRQYKVIETWNGLSAEYRAGEAGQLFVKNYNDNNPEPINPNEPKVVTGGAKFVKTNEAGDERLGKAEFVIKMKNENKFLKAVATNREAYKSAQKTFEDAVTKYNEAVKNSNQKVDLGNGEISLEEAKTKIAELEKERDAVWVASTENATDWSGTSKDDQGLLKLTSNDLGQFEISGLAPGSYTLVEIKAPEGYALPAKAEFDFTIDADGGHNKGSLNIDFGVKDETKDNDNAQQVINKKITIPQTGGIGAIIFAVAGIALMGFAVYAMKRNSQGEE